MSAAIHTRYRNGKIRAWTKDGRGIMAVHVPYAHELHHNRRHPAAAKALAERLGWSGVWIVGHNEDNSICAVQAVKTAGPEMLDAQRERYAREFGFEGEDWFFVGEESK